MIKLMGITLGIMWLTFCIIISILTSVLIIWSVAHMLINLTEYTTLMGG